MATKKTLISTMRGLIKENSRDRGDYMGIMRSRVRRAAASKTAQQNKELLEEASGVHAGAIAAAIVDRHSPGAAPPAPAAARGPSSRQPAPFAKPSTAARFVGDDDTRRASSTRATRRARLWRGRNCDNRGGLGLLRCRLLLRRRPRRRLVLLAFGHFYRNCTDPTKTASPSTTAHLVRPTRVW